MIKQLLFILTLMILSGLTGCLQNHNSFDAAQPEGTETPPVVDPPAPEGFSANYSYASVQSRVKALRNGSGCMGSGCHGSEFQSSQAATFEANAARFTSRVTNPTSDGGNRMPPSGPYLSDADILYIQGYLNCVGQPTSNTDCFTPTTQ